MLTEKQIREKIESLNDYIALVDGLNPDGVTRIIHEKRMIVKTLLEVLEE
jgi:hypothetical protein